VLENIHAAALSLSGEWEITLNEQTGTIRVPGVWELQGYPHDTEGPVLYRRVVDVPAAWDGARVYLHCDAVSYRAEVRVNGQPVGVHEGLWTAFEFEITDVIRPGEANQIELSVVKPGDEGDTFPYREVLVGFIPYVSITFGGPWQDIHLIAHRAPAWRDVHIVPDWTARSLRVSTDLSGDYAGLTATLEVLDRRGGVVAVEKRDLKAGDDDTQKFMLQVDNVSSWSPDDPVLYELRLRLRQGDSTLAETVRRFGFRKLHTEGDQLLFNGALIHLRGILSWGWDPQTLAPTPTEAQVRDEFRRVRELGFNMVKLCLFVPPPRLFEIADEEGMLLWLELPMWWQRLTDHLRRQAPIEYAGILAAVHHHPSVVIYSLGCELGTDMADAELLETLNKLARRMTGGDVLVCDNSGSGEAFEGLNFDFSDFDDYHFYSELHYFTPLLDHFRRDWRPARPWIFGEFCANEDYRDPAELVEADGGRPWWRDVLGVGSTTERWAYCEQEQRMTANDLPFTDQQLMEFARRQSFTVRKYIIEQTRTRRNIGGYVVTGLRDTPITTSGLFDDFDRHKFDPAQFRMFNAGTVLALEQGRARIWKDGDRPYPGDCFNYASDSPVSLRVILAHSDRQMDGGTFEWELLTPEGARHRQGTVHVPGPLQPGPPREIATLEWTFPPAERAGRWTLNVNLAGRVSNTWPLWLYPLSSAWHEAAALYDPGGYLTGLEDLTRHNRLPDDAVTVITGAFTPDVAGFVREGGRVILLQSGPGALPAQAAAFWGESIKLLYDHPVLAGFPHDGCADLQFYHLATACAFDIGTFHEAVSGLEAITPIIRRLHARTFRLLDYLVELKIGSGKVLASTLAFAGGSGDQVRGLRTSPAGQFLLYQMVDYLVTDPPWHK
jgi:hypothetical protein